VVSPWRIPSAGAQHCVGDSGIVLGRLAEGRAQRLARVVRGQVCNVCCSAASGVHMSVEPSESMGEAWTRWQGHVINGAFPLGRYLGSSDHSGVFLTESAARSPSIVAIKLVPTNRALAEAQLPRWKRAAALTHPHLLRLWELGGCQLDGLPYLYTVMEYADQTLAQLLQHRALTETEAREMLPPILDALAFLHSRNLVQGQLKPTNILVVGDQLKLASDTIRRLSEGAMSGNAPLAYDPPEAQGESSSPAGDVWALGISLFEALTRRAPSALGESGREAVALPADFPLAFRDIVTQCLSPSPLDRPSVTELVDFARGQSPTSAPAAPIQPATLAPPVALAPPEPVTPEPAAAQGALAQVAREAARPAPPTAQSPKPRGLLTVMLAAVAILVLGWTAVHVFRGSRTTVAHPPAVPTPGGSRRAAVATAAKAAAPVATVPTATPDQSDVAASSAPLHEAIPDVPAGARRTIRGHIKVWVRVIVNPDGSVFAAVVDRGGPSRYFRRVAIEAAKAWVFPPLATPSQRLMQIQFDFSRLETTGRAVSLR
jgi:outer membrane biosynthesis protein TonB